jgi:hypothetical protein
MKNKDGKEMQIEFAPGCFDQFDGTQEELEAFQKEIMEMIGKMTPEELEAQSTQVDEDYIEELLEEDPEAAEALIKALFNEPRKLQ